MLDRSSEAPRSRPSTDPYRRALSGPALVLLVLAGAWAWQLRPKAEVEAVRPPLPPSPRPIEAAKVETAVLLPPPPPVSKEPRPSRPPRPATVAPPLDRGAIAEAEEALDRASRERARAEARLAGAEKALELASTRAAKDLAETRSLADRVRDPSARVASIVAKGGFLRGERDKLKDELAALDRSPPAKATPLLAKSAVAKPTDGSEFHFEVRRDRVSFIDLDRLVEMVKTDARLRLRTGGSRGRLSSKVGPVGAFSLRYELGRTTSDALGGLLDGREISYNLLGWELIPEDPNRGESYDAAQDPNSRFSRAIGRLSPGHDTVTMWIYPDGFALYRALRDDLHARGFLVAARPLPEGTSIKGSPVGSVSAGQ